MQCYHTILFSVVGSNVVAFPEFSNTPFPESRDVMMMWFGFSLYAHISQVYSGMIL